MTFAFSLDITNDINQRRNLDDFTRGRVVSKLEGCSMTDVANELGIAKIVGRRLRERFYETGTGTRQYSFGLPAKTTGITFINGFQPK